MEQLDTHLLSLRESLPQTLQLCIVLLVKKCGLRGEE